MVLGIFIIAIAQGSISVGILGNNIRHERIRLDQAIKCKTMAIGSATGDKTGEQKLIRAGHKK